jgi:hypothetical protein
MHSPAFTFRGDRARLALGLAATLGLLAAAAPAQTTSSGSISVGGGGATSVDGNAATFQQRVRQSESGYGGLEQYTLTRTDDASLFRFEARAMPGDGDYRLLGRFEKYDAFYVEANFRQFRIFYDGSGGRLVPRNLSFSWFDEALELDRSYFSFELGTLGENRPQFRLRYDRNTREGAKNSIRWGDSNLAGAPFSPRAFIPSYLLVDEVRDIFTAEVSRRTDQEAWKVAGRYERSRVNNRHVGRRRIQEPQDRTVTSYEGSDSELFSGHATYERVLDEQLRLAAGGLSTTIDTNLSGSKIYGAGPDATYSPTFAARQQGDVGYYGLTGDTRLRQYVGNLNLVYTPDKYWTILPAIRYEHLRVDAGESHTDTNFAGAALAATQNLIEASSRDAWNEVTEDIEFRYRRSADWNFSARAQWNQGEGSLLEQSILLPAGSPVIDRDSDYERRGARYTAAASWYPRPGLTFGAQYNYRLKLADYRARRDRTSNATTANDRYPHFIVDQDIASQDVSLRASWRPTTSLSLVSRYAHQRATITSTFDNLPEIRGGRLVRHIVTQTATWNASTRLYLTGAFNVTYDQLWVPSNRYLVIADNNHTSASLGAGYVLGKVTDLFVDTSYYRADNYTDNQDFTLPLNAGHLMHSSYVTWVRRHTDRLVYTLRYGYVTNQDGTFAGLKDFDAHVVYGRVQYKF